MKATSMSPRSGQQTATSNTVVLLHGHQLDRNPARAVTAEAASTFVLVLVVVPVATDPWVPRGIAAMAIGAALAVASRAGSQGSRAARCPRAWRWSTSPNPREADPGHCLHRRRRWFRRLRPTGNREAGGEGAVRGSSPASAGPASEGTRAKRS